MKLLDGKTEWSSIDLDRVIYVDFEGLTDKHPVLLGVLPHTQSQLQQFIIDPAFAAMADASSSQALGLAQNATIEECVRHLRSHHSEPILVAWSSREQTLLSQPEWLGTADSVSIVDAKLVAKQWRKEFAKDIRPRKVSKFDPGSGHSLQFYEELIGYDRPKMLKAGNTTSRIRGVAAGLKSPGPLTPTQRGKWTRMLNHNAHDLLGMRAVLTRCLDELATRPYWCGTP